MSVSIRYACLLVVGFSMVCVADEPAPIKPIPRRIPPVGVQLPGDIRAKLLKRLGELETKLKAVDADRPGRPDAAVYLKGVRFAIEIGEFYKLKSDVPKAERALATAEKRIDHVIAGKTPWHELRGKTIVLGHVSKIDGSVQPLGITVPADLDLSKPVPLHVFLHGRGDKITDMHFIDRLEQTKCTWKTNNAIVLEPFGRQCIGWKGPGEVDVFEAIDRVKQLFKIDDDRVALIGFSMGGAGAWHIGAHYADRFAIVCPGAGFAETAEYLRLKPEDYPNKIEQKLWGVYDTPAYVRNLFNTKVVAYSGENDKQKQAADRMVRAFKEEGRELHHIIGPGMGHKYHPESLKELHRLVDEAIGKGRDPNPDKVYLQTRTLRYSRKYWLEALRLDAHWSDARIDAEITEPGRLKMTTHNVGEIWIRRNDITRFDIDGQSLELVPAVPLREQILRKRDNGKWRLWNASSRVDWPVYRKEPRAPGPIDDAFLGRFMVVLPSKPSESPAVERWVKFESAHFIQRWRTLFRGDPRVKFDKDVTRVDISRHNLILWGDPESNKLIRQVIEKVEIEWNPHVIVGSRGKYDVRTHVLSSVQPNPLGALRYIVLNSGPTFREAHDRTNSLQNPKLGDWAIVDVTVDPTGEAPGRVVEHGFFDERWKLPAE